MYSASLVLFCLQFWFCFFFKHHVIWGATRHYVTGDIMTAPHRVTSHCLLKLVNSLDNQNTSSTILCRGNSSSTHVVPLSFQFLSSCFCGPLPPQTNISLRCQVHCLFKSYVLLLTNATTLALLKPRFPCTSRI